MIRTALLKCGSLNRILIINKPQQLVLFRNATTGRRSGEDGPSTKKTREFPKITVQMEAKTLVMTLLEAQKLAKRRNFKLIQEEDPKTKRPIYKLVAVTEMVTKSGDDTTPIGESSKSQLKSEKQLTVGSRISDHDLSSRLKNISKWLAKQHEVRVLIQCGADDIVNGEKIYKTIEQSISTAMAIGKVVKKHTKGSAIKFTIVPILATPIDSS